jgi:hypothetical protein
MASYLEETPMDVPICTWSVSRIAYAEIVEYLRGIATCFVKSGALSYSNHDARM